MPKNNRTMPSDDFFQKRYPHIADWVLDGWIEIGRGDWGGAFIKVLDEGGLVWEGKQKYPTIDDALLAADRAIAAWIRKHG